VPTFIIGLWFWDVFRFHPGSPKNPGENEKKRLGGALPVALFRAKGSDAREPEWRESLRAAGPQSAGGESLAPKS